MTQPVKVGVTLRVNGEKGQQSIWENGIFQNCFFLQMTLAKAPHVSEAYVVLCGSATKEVKEDFMRQTKCKWMHEEEAAATLDVIIEMAINLDEKYLPAFYERGGKLIGAKVGNDYVIDTERIIFELPPASLVRSVKYAATWTIPEYKDIGVGYYEVLNRAPVKVLPHLWSPIVMANALLNHPTLKFEYVPGQGPNQIAIFEPNICMVKTCFIPLLICDEVYRADPKLFKKVLAFNTRQFVTDNEVFNGFASSLKLQDDGIVNYEGRLATFEVMARYANVAVCHQIENAQNYLYYELLWAGYPLVHNSNMLKGCGYYYPDFDTQAGARALVRALRSHDKRLDEHKALAANLVYSLDPTNPGNVRLYDEALVEALNS